MNTENKQNAEQLMDEFVESMKALGLEVHVVIHDPEECVYHSHSVHKSGNAQNNPVVYGKVTHDAWMQQH